MGQQYALERDERGLTARQREVLAGLTAGKNQVQIAEQLGVSKQRIAQVLTDLERAGVVKRVAGEYQITLKR
jgi:DNA-binding MarR family transcriptional regulator